MNKSLRLAQLILTLAAPMLCTAADRVSDKQIYWGDLHTHTSFSMDAYVLNNQTTPRDAYYFAKGGEISLPGGGTHKLARPLDFAAVTDHAEYFGLMQICHTMPLLPYCVELSVAAREDSRRGFFEFFLPTLLQGDRNCQVDDATCDAAEKSLWQTTIDAAEIANVPGQFTAFVASEWTASPNNLHWHRNLIYATATVPTRPINSFDEPSQESLWRALRSKCTNLAGCDVIAIPHNSNIGMGGSFNTQGHDKELLGLRAQFEKLVEIHQHKGSSECFPGAGFNDEACNFEIAMPIPLSDELRKAPRELTVLERTQISSGYVRPALAKGLNLFEQYGVNPFQYGFVGATDNHASRPGDVEESNWVGALAKFDDDLAKRQTYAEYNPGGLTAIWANENTREALFAALKRREIYATSGPRIRLSLHQSFDPTAGCEDLRPGDWLAMGGTLGQQGGDKKPTFIVQTLMDQVRIASIDLIKLYVRAGEIQQRVVRLAQQSEGRADWCIAWQDEDYRDEESALWYVRVLQIPTKRWDTKNMLQERAWSSPIWSMQK